MIKFPSQTLNWMQANRGETLGVLWSSSNIDTLQDETQVTSQGAVAVNTTDDAGMTNLALISAFAYFKDATNSTNKRYFALSEAVFYGGTQPKDTFQEFLGGPTNSGEQYADMKIFNDKLYVFTSNAVTKLTPGIGGGSWSTVSGSSLTSGTSHKLAVFKSTQRLYYTDENKKVYSMSLGEAFANTTGDYIFDATAYGIDVISWIECSSQTVWIGCITKGGNGVVIAWDGVTENLYNGMYTLDTPGSLACIIKDDTPYIIDVSGKLLSFNGSGFSEVARLPVANGRYYLSNFASVGMHQRAISPNGVMLRDGVLYVAVNGQETSSYGYNHRNPGGIYTYNFLDNSGFKHFISASLNRTGEDQVDYSVLKPVRLTAMIDGVGGDDITYSEDSGTILFGGQVKALDSGSSVFGIFRDDTANEFKKLSSITTVFVASQNVTDVYSSIYTKYSKLLDTTDKLIVKHRSYITESDVFSGNITSTTTFTSTGQLNSLQIGDEITIVNGASSGLICHVTNKTYLAGTWTVTIDENFLSNTGEFQFVYANFKKINVANNTIMQYNKYDIPTLNKDIKMQFKVSTLWEGGNYLEELDIVNNSDLIVKS